MLNVFRKIFSKRKKQIEKIDASINKIIETYPSVKKIIIKNKKDILNKI